MQSKFIKAVLPDIFNTLTNRSGIIPIATGGVLSIIGLTR